MQENNDKVDAVNAFRKLNEAILRKKETRYNTPFDGRKRKNKVAKMRLSRKAGHANKLHSLKPKKFTENFTT